MVNSKLCHSRGGGRQIGRIPGYGRDRRHPNLLFIPGVTTANWH